MSQEPPVQPPMQPPPGGADPTASSGGGMNYTATGGGPTQVAEWWKRLVAALIDNVILWIGQWILLIPFGVMLGGLAGGASGSIDPATGQPSAGFLAALWGTYGAMVLILTVLVAAYYIVLHGMKGQTVGKMAMKIKVVDEPTGGAISYGTAAKRILITWLGVLVTCGIFGLVDGLWPLWDPKGQALHDKIANTLVVDA